MVRRNKWANQWTQFGHTNFKNHNTKQFKDFILTDFFATMPELDLQRPEAFSSREIDGGKLLK